MGRGRPPKPGTAEEKAAARRERVRNNVRALRERRKQEAASKALEHPTNTNVDTFTIEWIQAETGPDGFDKSLTEIEDEEETSDAKSIVPKRAPSASGPGASMYLVNQRTDSRTKIPSSVDDRSLYALGMIATVRQMFLPDSIHLPSTSVDATSKPWNSGELLWTPCAFWVTSAFARASEHETSVLKMSLLSIGMLIKGVEHQDMALQTASLEMYRRCLRGIRKTLEPMIQGGHEKPKDRVSLYLACHAAAMFELVQNSDLSATMRHLRGVSQLICHLGDDSDEEGQSMAWLLLQDYRFAEMGLCMKFRYASYSSIARRQFEKTNIEQSELPKSSKSGSIPATARGRGSQNMLVTLTDIADDISAIMMQLDAMKPKLAQPETPAKLRRVLERLDQIWQGFPSLHDRLIRVYGNAFVYSDTEDDGGENGSYKFQNFDIGAGWCYNLMTQLYCLETSIEATTTLLKILEELVPEASTPDTIKSSTTDNTNVESLEEFATSDRLQELRRLHRAICIQLTQCLLYFLQTDKGITGQALAIYPLDAALNMLMVEMERLKVDIKHAQLEQKPKEYISMIFKDLVNMGNAKTFVQKMQSRAKAFGLPSFHGATAGDFTTNKVKQ